VSRTKAEIALVIVGGVAMTFFLGVLGTISWMTYLWMSLPLDVRARIPAAKRNAVLATAVVVVVVGVAGFAATVVGLLQAFGAVSHVAPEEKAARLADGISTAMTWTTAALVAQLVGVVGGFVVGIRLLRLS